MPKDLSAKHASAFLRDVLRNGDRCYAAWLRAHDRTPQGGPSGL